MSYCRDTVEAALKVCDQMADNEHYDPIARAAAKSLRERIGRLAPGTRPVAK